MLFVWDSLKIPKMKAIYYLALFFFSPGFSSQDKAQAQRLMPSIQTAQKALRQVLKIYHLKPMQIKIEQEIVLSAVKTSMKSHGALDINGKKFYLKLKGQPSSVMLFDGKFLWYQPDTNEKVVFLLKKPSRIQILTSFFDETSFFKHFHIQQARKKGQDYILQLIPKKQIEGLSEVFIKFSSHISEFRIIWKDLNNWQKYKFSKPRDKKFSDQHFEFFTEGFQVITKKGARPAL